MKASFYLLLLDSTSALVHARKCRTVVSTFARATGSRYRSVTIWGKPPFAFTCKAATSALWVICNANIHSTNPLAHGQHHVPVDPFLNASDCCPNSTWKTLGISLAQIHFAPYGLNSRPLSQGDPSTPRRETNAVAFAGLSSPNPGVITIANAVFGSKSNINTYVLVNAFQLDKNVVIFSHGAVMQEPSGSEEVYPGDVSVFPVDLIHFRFNIRKRTQLPSLVSAARIQLSLALNVHQNWLQFNDHRKN
ncbi:hypothetical protein V6N13_014988 [Hibiscus sabdariffa]